MTVLGRCDIPSRQTARFGLLGSTVVQMDGFAPCCNFKVYGVGSVGLARGRQEALNNSTAKGILYVYMREERASQQAKPLVNGPKRLLGRSRDDALASGIHMGIPFLTPPQGGVKKIK